MDHFEGRIARHVRAAALRNFWFGGKTSRAKALGVSLVGKGWQLEASPCAIPGGEPRYECTSPTRSTPKAPRLARSNGGVKRKKLPNLVGTRAGRTTRLSIRVHTLNIMATGWQDVQKNVKRTDKGELVSKRSRLE